MNSGIRTTQYAEKHSASSPANPMLDAQHMWQQLDDSVEQYGNRRTFYLMFYLIFYQQMQPPYYFGGLITGYERFANQEVQLTRAVDMCLSLATPYALEAAQAA